MSAFELYLCLNLKVCCLQLQHSELLKMEVRKSSVLYLEGCVIIAYVSQFLTPAEVTFELVRKLYISS